MAALCRAISTRRVLTRPMRTARRRMLRRRGGQRPGRSWYRSSSSHIMMPMGTPMRCRSQKRGQRPVGSARHRWRRGRRRIQRRGRRPAGSVQRRRRTCDHMIIQKRGRRPVGSQRHRWRPGRKHIRKCGRRPAGSVHRRRRKYGHMCMRKRDRRPATSVRRHMAIRCSRSTRGQPATLNTRRYPPKDLRQLLRRFSRPSTISPVHRRGPNGRTAIRQVIIIRRVVLATTLTLRRRLRRRPHRRRGRICGIGTPAIAAISRRPGKRGRRLATWQRRRQPCRWGPSPSPWRPRMSRKR
mmetsp:Transcript_119923/g.344602  ORF Transcript_119923/g.344602 Transcript_119923/m.344602 type:complete len:297 (+) Transcript_119923:1764-2654(+)